MAITGKIWSAVLYRHQLGDGGGDPLTGLGRTLFYNPALTTPAKIASYYPALSWDETFPIAPAAMFATWLPYQYLPFGPKQYADTETAILNQQTYNETIEFDGRGQVIAYSFTMRYKNEQWLHTYEGSNYAGDPTEVSDVFANTGYNITTDAPFGTGLGYGTITHKKLYWDSGSPPIQDWAPVPPFGASILSATSDNILDVYVVDQTYIFTPVDDGSGAGGATQDGGGDGAVPFDGSPDASTGELILRSWGFSLDGHDFYVLRLGDSATLVYDLTTGSWSEWETPGRTNWRPHVGQNWIGNNVFNYDTDVIAGDDSVLGPGEGTLWQLSTTAGRDDRADISIGLVDDKITKVVVGGIQVTGRDTIPCNAVTLDVALGDPTQTGAYIQLEISDDLGQTWIDCGTQIIAAGDTSAVIEWRSLGEIKAPGRLFRFTDDGATVRFGGANLR